MSAADVSKYLNVNTNAIRNLNVLRYDAVYIGKYLPTFCTGF
jgi:hypothetical protein